MTHICYTLEEAAGKLNLSETVLVRLSQYFKVPKGAYEDVGYLSFKGDLAFSDQDIAFFRQVKERLLAGESLEEVKSRIRQESIPPLSAQDRQPSENPPQAAASASRNTQGVTRPAMQTRQDSTQDTMPMMAAMREIQDRTPYEKAAEKSFARYKSMHRSGLSKVFENMLKEVGGATKKRPSSPLPKPLRTKVKEPEDYGQDEFLQDEFLMESVPTKQKDSILPFKSLHRPAVELKESPSPLDAGSLSSPGRTSELWNRGQTSGPGKASSNEASWERIIQQAVDHPRRLDNHLKNAATLLREQALQQPPGQSSHPHSR